VNIYSIFICHD